MTISWGLKYKCGGACETEAITQLEEKLHVLICIYLFIFKEQTENVYCDQESVGGTTKQFENI